MTAYANDVIDGSCCSHGFHTFGDRILSPGVSNQYYLIEADMYSSENSTKYGLAVGKSISDWCDTATLVSVRRMRIL